MKIHGREQHFKRVGFIYFGRKHIRLQILHHVRSLTAHGEGFVNGYHHLILFHSLIWTHITDMIATPDLHLELWKSVIGMK